MLAIGQSRDRRSFYQVGDIVPEKIDAFNATERRTEREPEKGTSGYLKIIDFQEKQKNLESAKFKAL